MPNFSIEPNDGVRFAIAHEDSDVVVVDKPARLVTQPGLGHERDTLLNGLFSRWGPRLQNQGKDRDFGLLHRLDKDASGLLIVALTPRAYDALRQAFEERTIGKFYWAICHGRAKADKGVIRKPISEREGEMKTAVITSRGKPALTAWRLVQSSASASLIEARPVTGRLHQLRVHLDAIGMPILGDPIYGQRASDAPRLALHAHRLAFDHPITAGRVDARSAFPRDLRGVLKRHQLLAPPKGDPSKNGHHGAHDAVGDQDPAIGE